MTNTENKGCLRPWSPATYRIEVEGRLPESCSDFFPLMQITTREQEDQSIVTCLTGRLICLFVAALNPDVPRSLRLERPTHNESTS